MLHWSRSNLAKLSSRNRWKLVQDEHQIWVHNAAGLSVALQDWIITANHASALAFSKLLACSITLATICPIFKTGRVSKTTDILTPRLLQTLAFLNVCRNDDFFKEWFVYWFKFNKNIWIKDWLKQLKDITMCLRGVSFHNMTKLHFFTLGNTKHDIRRRIKFASMKYSAVHTQKKKLHSTWMVTLPIWVAWLSSNGLQMFFRL